MKKIVFLLALAAATLCAPARAQEEVEITYQDFYDGLSPYGDWVYVDGYGYCWQPRVEEGWRPYTNGGWVYTDAGWTWSSDEEWGWATDHYGRWMRTTEFGWLWVPGYEWAPAWVAWRKSDEYVGWAPLPPEATWQPASGFGPSVDVSFGIGPEYYNFCPVRHLGAPRLRPYIVPLRENVTIINNSVNVTKITNVNNVFIFNEGPDFREIQRRSEQPVRWARLERRWDVDREVVRAGKVRNRVDGDVFRVVSPRVERRPTREERPPKVVATVRNEEFDKRIGEERRRVRERTREMNRSAEADIPPPPDGRDQRFEPSRQDLRDVPENQRVTDQQRRRERGSRELQSETPRDDQRNVDQTPGRDRQRREERRDGPENSSQRPPPSDSQRLEADQPGAPGDQPGREERTRGRSDGQGRSEGREMRGDQESRDAQRREQRRGDQSEESLQGAPPPAQAGDTPTRQTAREKTQGRENQVQRPPQNRREDRGEAQEADGQRKQGRGVDQSESSQGAPPGRPPAPDSPGAQPTRDRSQRDSGEQNAAEKSRESRRESERPNVQPKQAEAPKTPPENVQQRRQGGENGRQEQRSGPPAERRESNVQQQQQQQQRGDQKAQGEKSGRPQGQQQQSRGGQKGGKGDKSGSKGEGEGSTQSSEGQSQDGRGQ
jgi:hypothetical protein